MPTDVIMPQMGESIFEGTLTKWLKKPGEKIQRDEPLFEISTDKVDAEIPAPASGVLKEIKVQEGTTVQVNTVVGVIDAEGAAAAASSPPEPARPATAQSSAATDGSSKAPVTPRAGGNGRTGAPAASPSPVGETEVDTTRRAGGDVNAAARPAEQRAVQQQQATVTTLAP